MSYPNELRYPQNRAGLYAESNCYSGLIVNVNPQPYVQVPSLADMMLTGAISGALCRPFQFSQKCTSFVSGSNKSCIQNGTNRPCSKKPR